MNSNNEVLVLSKIIWDYHKLNQEIKPSDLIFALGSIDLRTAQRASELYKQSYAPKILFSGGLAHTNDLLNTGWDKPEAVILSEEAIRLGVPQKDILIEDKATNTGENITLGYKVLKNNNINPKSIILVQKPYMERRTYATFSKQWPGEDVTIYVTSPQIPFDEYLVNTDDENRDRNINIMVGDLQRIKIYPDKGFQIYQEIPDNVWKAYERLIELGYDKHLI